MAKQAWIDVEATKEAGRQEHDIVAAPTPVATPAATFAAITAQRPNSRKHASTRCMFLSTLDFPSFLVIDALASI